MTIKEFNDYDYNITDKDWFENIDTEPVTKEEITGKSIKILDVPSYLNRPLENKTQPNVALYRLVQLFGTPNIPQLQVEIDEEVERNKTTWCYLFNISFNDEENNVEEEFMIAVYDYKTNVSFGLAYTTEGNNFTEPQEEKEEWMTVYEEDFLVGIAQVVLNLVSQTVPATYKGLQV